MSTDHRTYEGDPDRFTPDQRRRAEALALVRFLFPNTTPTPEWVLKAARWIGEGGPV